MPTETVTFVTAIVGATTGIGSLALGAFNTWNQVRKERVVLKVEPAHAIPVGEMETCGINFCIGVVNHSVFPVVLVDVGFLLKDGRRATLMHEGYHNPGPLPRRLEPRTSYTNHFRLTSAMLDLRSIKSAYALTDCGHRALGTSEALGQLVREGVALGE